MIAERNQPNFATLDFERKDGSIFRKISLLTIADDMRRERLVLQVSVFNFQQ